MNTNSGSKVYFFHSLGQEVEWIEEAISGSLAPGEGCAEARQISVLEAGCGREWQLNLGVLEPTITGLDINAEALAHRTNNVKDLDRAILGDVTTAELEASSFDLTYSAYVLEHVKRVAEALRNFDYWTRGGGLIVLRLPDRDSVFGAAARYTPHRIHVWFYRYLLGSRLAGVGGRPPFPTVYESAMSRPQLRAFFGSRGYEIIGEGVTRPFPGKHGLPWAAVRLLLQLVGRISGMAGNHTNFTIIVRKPWVDDAEDKTARR